MKKELKILQYFMIFIMLNLAFSSCQKDLDISGEVVLVKNELIIKYPVTNNGQHIVSLFESEADLIAGINSLQIEHEKIYVNAGVNIIEFDNIATEQVFVKLKMLNFIGLNERAFKYNKSIKFPDYNAVVTREIKTSEWEEI